MTKNWKILDFFEKLLIKLKIKSISEGPESWKILEGDKGWKTLVRLYCKNEGFKLIEARKLSNISQKYEREEKYKLSLIYLEKSLKIQRKIDDKLGLSTTLFNIGHSFLKNKEAKKAFESWLEAYQIGKQIGDEEVLNALDNLAGNLGLENKLEIWEALVQQFNE